MKRMSKRGAVVATAGAAVVAVALPAWAYYALTSNTTTATATARTLGTPVAGVPVVTPGGITFSVGAPASGPTPTGYRVDRTAPSAVAGVCALPAGGGTCTDPSPVAGQTNRYAVHALLASWQSPVPAAVAAVAAAPSFTVTSSTATPMAGTPFTVTITARNGSAIETAYAGSKTLTWDGGKQIGAFRPVYPSPLTFTSGVATASVTLYKAGAQTLTVADANTTAYQGAVSVTVAAATPALAFSSCPTGPARNSSFTTTVTRTDADPYGNPVATGALTVTLAPSSGSAKFTTGSTTIAADALASPVVTFNTPSSSGATSTLSASAAGHTAAACSITTS